jgi:hypothetical protein
MTKQTERFYRAVIRKPDGPGERVLTGKATRALAERMATKEAEKVGWHWLVQHCESLPGGDEGAYRLLEQWSSIAGHEIIEGVDE